MLSEFWENLEESIRIGQPVTNFYQWVEKHPAISHDFQTWMVALARLTADEILGKLKLETTARRLLDVGGGHAMYSVAFCRQYPALSATVFDSPQALQTAQESIAAAKMDDRIAIQAGDFLNDDLGAEYDVALLFNIVHGISPDQNIELLRKVAAALNPGGVVVIAEQIEGKAPGPASKAIAQVLGMSYFHLLGGRIYTFDEIAQLLSDISPKK